LGWSSTTPSVFSMPPPSTCAGGSFPGRCYAPPCPPSTSIPCWIHAATSRPFIHISDGELDDANVLDILLPRVPAAWARRFFVIRATSNTKYRRRYSHPAEKSGGVRCDQTIALTGAKSRRDYPQPLRRIKYQDAQTGKTFNLLTNNFTIPAQTVAHLFRYCWQVEPFSKWIKQHLRIKSFFGSSGEPCSKEPI